MRTPLKVSKDKVKIVYASEMYLPSEGELAIQALCDELEQARITLQKTLLAHTNYTNGLTNKD